MKALLPIIVGFVLVAVCFIGQGLATQRFTGGTSKQMEVMAMRFDEIRARERFGDWERLEMGELADYEIKGSGSKNYLRATFKHQPAGKVVSVLLICGFGRDVGVHTPERCFVGSGLNMQGEPALRRVTYRQVMPDTGKEKQRAMLFKHARFLDPETTRETDTLWAWNAYSEPTERWFAPSSARYHYGGGTPLSKVYVTVDHETMMTSPELVEDFVKAFLLEVNEILGPEPAEFELEAAAART
ncbi:MAG: hypothetical protein DWQ31_20900 [Planctomycetota bacterium]|nr:MAG: hypothetical protein DWQ31_20900 [Planctomycetota bacterium]REJ88456.1 MAG: hypothetical protein DWQ35_19840 [Planctomycetota bacterium]